MEGAGAIVVAVSMGTLVFVHRSSQLEALVDALWRVVEEPLGSPFTAETIVVPARPLGDWLALHGRPPGGSTLAGRGRSNRRLPGTCISRRSTRRS